MCAGPGWYIFIAPPAVSQKNDTARLVSPLITDNTPRCLSFYYFMFGASVNLLNVYVKSSGQTGLGNLVWQRKGTQGDMWVHAMIEVKPTLTYQVFSQMYMYIFLVDFIRQLDHRRYVLTFAH